MRLCASNLQNHRICGSLLSATSAAVGTLLSKQARTRFLKAVGEAIGVGGQVIGPQLVFVHQADYSYVRNVILIVASFS